MPSSISYPSDQFVLSAGSVLFRQHPETGNLQICILYNRKRKQWVLPKGRKDCGEVMEETAIRETFEETGYECEFLPCRMPTRAPLPDLSSHPRVVNIVDNIVEPVAITVRHLSNGSVKIIWWYLTRVKSNSAPPISGTQTASEDFESHFCDIESGVALLEEQLDYKNVAIQAVNLVQKDIVNIVFNP